MSFGKKKDNTPVTPTATYTPNPQKPEESIKRTANSAEAQDRANEASGASSLLATSMTDEEKLKRQQGGAGTLSTY